MEQQSFTPPQIDGRESVQTEEFDSTEWKNELEAICTMGYGIPIVIELYKKKPRVIETKLTRDVASDSTRYEVEEVVQKDQRDFYGALILDTQNLGRAYALLADDVGTILLCQDRDTGKAYQDLVAGVDREFVAGTVNLNDKLAALTKFLHARGFSYQNNAQSREEIIRELPTLFQDIRLKQEKEIAEKKTLAQSILTSIRQITGKGLSAGDWPMLKHDD